MKRIALLCGALALIAGCAHQQPPAVTTEEHPAPVAAKPAPPPVETTAPSQQQEDLSALLAGSMIHFDFDRAELTQASRERLQALARALEAHPELRIRIDGNCDEAGTEEYNLALGQRRADSAEHYLSTLGIDPKRLQTVTYGKEHPLSLAHDADAWATNRRDGFTPLGN